MKVLSVFAVIMFFAAQFSIAQKSENTTKSNAEIKFLTSSHCGSCKGTIEGAVNKVKGVTKSDLDLTSKIVTVSYDNSVANAETIKKAIVDAGYKAELVCTDKKTEGTKSCSDKKTKKTKKSGCCPDGTKTSCGEKTKSSCGDMK